MKKKKKNNAGIYGQIDFDPSTIFRGYLIGFNCGYVLR